MSLRRCRRRVTVAVAMLLIAACSGGDERRGLLGSRDEGVTSSPGYAGDALGKRGSVLPEQVPAVAPRTSGGTPRDPSTVPAGVLDNAGSVAPIMLVRTGRATVEVASVDTAAERLRRLVQRLGGYVANTSAQGGKRSARSATLELKVPAARFDELTAGLRPIGTLETLDVTAEDVGEEYVDMTARLANSRRLEQRLTELLAQRTGKLSDVLEVERELARVREEIERYEGRARYLRTRAAVSTLTVTVREPEPVLGAQVGQNPIAEAFRTAWRVFLNFIAFLIASLGVVVPVVVLAAIAWAVWRRLRRPGA